MSITDVDTWTDLLRPRQIDEVQGSAFRSPSQMWGVLRIKTQPRGFRANDHLEAREMSAARRCDERGEGIPHGWRFPY